jgi:hypothetical protein
MQQEQPKQLSPRWTKELLERCTPREILVIAAAYSVEQVAKRMGYTDIQKFIQERQ